MTNRQRHGPTTETMTTTEFQIDAGADAIQAHDDVGTITDS